MLGILLVHIVKASCFIRSDFEVNSFPVLDVKPQRVICDLLAMQ